eukprot:01016.XXX_2035_372_1 [CDS] Oithona nana genome sequencing.
MNRPPDENRLRMEANRLMMEENRDRGGRFDMDFRPNENRLRMAANRLMMDENHPDPHRDRNRPIENRLRMEANRLMQEENRRFEDNRDRGPILPFNDHRRFQPENRRSFSPQPRTESPNSSRNFVQEWNKGVRGPVSERPRSPGPVQEDLDTPASPEVKEDSPESPTMTSTPASPKATEEDTPASPVDTPMSPMDDTPASPPPQAEVKPVTNEAKMIPLERQNILKKVKSEKTETTQKQFDIRAPKDWHRGLRDRGPASSASPSSECSDDSDKVCQKRLQIVESPASSSPASPASGESVNKPPPVLPVPQVPNPVVLPSPIPSTGPSSSSSSIPPKKSLKEFMHPRTHPSRPPRPTLLEAPQWRRDHMSQPRLPNPPSGGNHDFRPHLPQPPRPSMMMHQPQQQPPRPEVRKPLTYGEYRKLREEAEKRHHRQPPQQPSQDQGL